MRFPFKGSCLRWFKRKAPMEVDAPESGCLVQVSETVACEGLRHLVLIPLPGKIEPRHHAGVLVEARSLWEAA